MAVVLVLLNLLSIGTALKCFSGKLDCFPDCVENAIEAAGVDAVEEAALLIESCSFNLSNGEKIWSCARSLETCGISADCTKGLNLAVEVECEDDEYYCYDRFRRPQNSRFGKTPVWGFEAVHERGCAKNCTAFNASMATGVGQRCCKADLCNAGIAGRGPHLILAVVSFITIFTR